MSMNDKELMAMNEYENIKKLALEKGVKGDGVWVMKKLKELGWVNISYKKYSKYNSFSKFSVRCGYDGSYQKSKLVKGFYKVNFIKF